MSIILYINYTIYNVPDIHVLYSDLSYDLEPFKGQIDVQEANVLCNAHLNNNAQLLIANLLNYINYKYICKIDPLPLFD